MTYIAFVIVEFAAPMFPTLISAAISIIALHRSKRVSKSSARLKSRPRLKSDISIKGINKTAEISDGRLQKHQATTTILIITLFYTLCNIPLTIYLCLSAIDIFSLDSSILYFDREYFHLGNLLLVISVAVNAAGNPLLYLSRNTQQKRYVRRSWQRVKRDVALRWSTVESRLDGTCNSRLDGTCNSKIDGTCNSKIDGTCNSKIDGACNSKIDGTCNIEMDCKSRKPAVPEI